MGILAELPFDDIASDNFPVTSHRQQRRQAGMRAAESLAVALHASNRPTKALDLVLADAVTINSDGTAQVHSGNRTYAITEAEGCTCEDARRRTRFCKHYIDTLISKRAAALLQGTQNASGQESPGEAMQPVARKSVGWQVHEAPVACTLTLVCKGVDVHLTMRDVSDDALFAWIKRILPKIQQKMQTPSTNGKS